MSPYLGLVLYKLKGKVHRGMVRFVRSDLEKQLSELNANNGNETEIQDTESKLTQLREKQIKGIMTRVKAKWRVGGEKLYIAKP
jgi:hypothetical protein